MPFARWSDISYAELRIPSLADLRTLPTWRRDTLQVVLVTIHLRLLMGGSTCLRVDPPSHGPLISVPYINLTCS